MAKFHCSLCVCGVTCAFISSLKCRIIHKSADTKHLYYLQKQTFFNFVKHVEKFPKYIWRAPYILEYPSKKQEGFQPYLLRLPMILCLNVGIRSIPFLVLMIYVFKFLITLTLCFSLGKSPWVGDIGKCGVELVYCLILTPLLGEWPHVGTFQFTQSHGRNFQDYLEDTTLKRGGILCYS